MGRDTRADICQAATEIISTKGYEKASLREIAEAVGITKASLYYHFSSKNELFDAILAPLLTDLRSALDEVSDREWSEEAAQVVLGQFIDSFITHRAIGAWLARDMCALSASEHSLKELRVLIARLHLWLAGPDASFEDRIRAVAATEIVGGVLSSLVSVADAPPEVLRKTLLESSMAVLSLHSHRGTTASATSSTPERHAGRPARHGAPQGAHRVPHLQR